VLQRAMGLRDGSSKPRSVAGTDGREGKPERVQSACVKREL
jgi:hypothetical protein